MKHCRHCLVCCNPFNALTWSLEKCHRWEDSNGPGRWASGFFSGTDLPRPDHNCSLWTWLVIDMACQGCCNPFNALAWSLEKGGSLGGFQRCPVPMGFGELTRHIRGFWEHGQSARMVTSRLRPTAGMTIWISAHSWHGKTHVVETVT